MDGWMDRRMDGFMMDEWMDRRMDDWMDCGMNTWVHGRPAAKASPCLLGAHARKPAQAPPLRPPPLKLHSCPPARTRKQRDTYLDVA
eukprot:364484-Chlamydomonas_euryale.AAC.1